MLIFLVWKIGSKLENQSIRSILLHLSLSRGSIPKLISILSQSSNQSGKEAQIAKSLLGKIAIANARLAYEEFRKVFESERFQKLQAKGAKLQRPLWASTSTKNPAYPDTMYVDELIGKHTVNTVPPQTLVAFKDHGKVQLTLKKTWIKRGKIFPILKRLAFRCRK